MRNRVERLLGQQASRARLCTFHSFAADILRQHGSHLGLRPDFSLLVQDEDRIAILEDVAADLSGNGDHLPSDRRNLLRFVDRLFAESYDGGEMAASLVRFPTWAPPLYRGYRQALVSENRLDFGSLLHFACRLLREKPGVARLVRLGWTHVCVDEFQDTNKAQYDLLRLIAPRKMHNLFVVADDDQVIYQWNGASPERLAHLRRDYSMRVVQLPECYRCPPSIVAVANRLIAYKRRKDVEQAVPDGFGQHGGPLRWWHPMWGVRITGSRGGIHSKRHPKQRARRRRMCRVGAFCKVAVGRRRWFDQRKNRSRPDAAKGRFRVACDSRVGRGVALDECQT